ncbi:MAG: hypothetical protein CSA89_01360 [Bacteroidales bacterium]|nr:MAG: hypothetical protein CSA89_01360 [Bacteroidales bacterium]
MVVQNATENSIKIMKNLKLKIRKTILIVFVSFFSIFSTYAQFDGVFSHYMHNLSLVNPSYAGENNMIQASLFQRTQWIGMPGAPIMSVLSVDTPFKLLERQHGVGVQFLSDIFGVFNNQQVKLLYAYKYKLGKGHFSFATNIGMINVICNADSINISKLTTDDGYHSDNDPAIPIGKQTGVGFDLGFGLNYVSDTYSLGASLTHVNSPIISIGDKNEFNVLPLMQVNGAYRFPLDRDNGKYKINTNVLFLTDFAVWTSHLSSILEINEKYWAGVGYRYQDSFSIQFGLELFDGFRLGYNFDIPSNRLILNTFGSHEVFATYEFSLVRQKSNSTKSIRIL